MTIVAGQYDSFQQTRHHRLGRLPQRDLPMLEERVLPLLRTLIKLGYFSLSVEGAEHVPRQGPAIYVGNHAGWFTMDTVFGALAVTDYIGVDRLPWGAVQDQLLLTPKLGRFFEGFGGFPASWLRTPEDIPPEMEVFSIYPEGAEGNCKSFVHAYQMRPWRTSFVRLAAARGAAIVPVAILGGEECLPVVCPIHVIRPLLGTVVPLPFLMLPLPARWRFIFHEPVFLDPSALGSERDDLETKRRRARDVAERIRAIVQVTLDREASDRPLVRFSNLLKRTVS